MRPVKNTIDIEREEYAKRNPRAPWQEFIYHYDILTDDILTDDILTGSIAPLTFHPPQLFPTYTTTNTGGQI